MEKEVLVKVEGVSKKFAKDLKKSLLYGLADVSAGVFRKNLNTELRKTEFWAVQDVSFEVRRGECLGLIGHNGAGKSTLLKMLNGLIRPDKGTIEMRGRVGALIELGSGFNPILTGRENIYNNGAVLGFTKAEIDAKFDEIIEFSEIGEFIDTPVQNYSSGMKVRLGFAVAAQMEPDVLILDEVFAVGDAGFRIKSFNKISEIMQNSAVIFVSHSMQTVARICNKTIYMKHGHIINYSDSVSKAIESYFNDFPGEKTKIEYNEGAEIKNLIINHQINNPEEPILINYLKDLILELDITLKIKVESFYIMFQITDKDMRIVGQYFTNYQYNFFDGSQAENHIKVTFPQIQFIDGEYSITYFIAYNKDKEQRNSYEYLAVYRHFSKFRVVGINDTLYAAVHLQAEVYQNQKKLIEKHAHAE